MGWSNPPDVFNLVGTYDEEVYAGFNTRECFFVPNWIGHRQLLAGAFEGPQIMDRVIPGRRVAAEIIYSFHVTLTFLRFWQRGLRRSPYGVPGGWSRLWYCVQANVELPQTILPGLFSKTGIRSGELIFEFLVKSRQGKKWNLRI